MRRDAKLRLMGQEGRSQYANRAAEGAGVKGLEARLKDPKAAASSFHPPVGATQWVDDLDDAAKPKADD